ncbi:MAG: redox-sensing transcriptional repressor Rex, partial [Candidatus Omnitrophica bacterium]|nr:redox-sensing transcriptional repressor Rex [Candidatus Omnitrophota bacterium]
YQIDNLLEKLNNILGKDQVQQVIIVGAGNIASALMKYKGFEKEGLRIAAAFDIDPAKFKKNNEIPILPLEELKTFVKDNRIKISIIAVPDIAAQQVADLLFGAGIKGILNFAPTRLKSPDDCVVNYVNLEHELENLIYFVNVLDKTKVK